MIPNELKMLKQWLRWKRIERNGKVTKMPIQCDGSPASSTDPGTWCTYNDAIASAVGDGVGFVFANGYAGIDFDHVRDVVTGVIEPWCLAIVKELDSYADISQSGTGIHTYVKGNLEKGKGNRHGRVEMYSEGRFFVMTGNALVEGASEVRDIDLIPWQARLKTLDPLVNTSFVDLTGGSQSEDDYALACDLARIHGCDETRVKEAFLAQAVKRSKLERVDYVQGTVAKACADVKGQAVVLVKPDMIALKDMPEECLEGRLGQIAMEQMNGFSRAYSYISLLLVCSALVPHETNSRTNLYGCLVGGVHSGKSSAFDVAFALFPLADRLLFLKAGSAEGLIKKAGDAGGRSRLLYPDELAHLLEKGQILGASFARVLTSAFYYDKDELIIAGGKVLKYHARLSVAGGVVSEQFADLFGSVTTGGLYDRFLFGQAPTGARYLWEPLPLPIVVQQPKWLDMFCPVTLDASVFTERNRWIIEGHIDDRVAEIAIRCAVVCASVDGRTRLTGNMLGPAFHLAKYQMKVRAFLQPNPGENPDAKMAFKELNFLREIGRAHV